MKKVNQTSTMTMMLQKTNKTPPLVPLSTHSASSYYISCSRQRGFLINFLRPTWLVFLQEHEQENLSQKYLLSFVWFYDGMTERQIFYSPIKKDEHISFFHIPKKAHFVLYHIPSQSHSKKSTYWNKHMPKRAHAEKSTCHKEDLLKRANAEKCTCWKEHIFVFTWTILV